MRSVVAVMLVVLCVACSRTHDSAERLAGASAQDGSRGGASGRSSTGDDAGGSGSSSVGMHDAAITPNAQDASGDDVPPAQELPTRDAATTEHAREVWVGELWSVRPTLCDPAQDEPNSLDPMGYTEPVVLVLEPGEDPSRPSGVIAFGQGDLPEEPVPSTSADDTGGFWLCSVQVPSKGGVYPLLAARREDERLTFDIVPSQIWSKACTDDPEACFGCQHRESCHFVGRPRTLDLAIEGDTMQGTPGRTTHGTPTQLRLQRMQ
jgi:hypothetical protein